MVASTQHKDGCVVEVVATYRGTTIDVRHIGDPGVRGIGSSYRLGAAPNLECPVAVPDAPASDDAFALVRVRDRVCELSVTAAMSATLIWPEGPEALPAAHGGAPTRVVLPSQATAELVLGDLSFTARHVAWETPQLQRNRFDGRFWRYNAGTFAVLGSALLAANLYPTPAPAVDLTDPEFVTRYADFRPPPDERRRASAPPGAPAEGSGQHEVAFEDPAADEATIGQGEAPGNAASSDHTVEDVAGFGTGLSQQSGHFLASPYGAAFAVGNEDEDVWGSLTGTEVGDAFGDGGIGLVGTARDAYGTGDGTVGLGNVGLVSRGGGFDPDMSNGRPLGSGRASYRGPRVRQARPKTMGSMDADIVRRIVRAHINEVRYCYNQGLVRDHELAGRVSIQFTITPTGRVPTAVVANSTLDDKEVGTCIAKAVKRWKFPSDSAGNTVITYPFVLEPG